MLLSQASANTQFERCFEKALEKKRLFNVVFELTHCCNFNCIHCYVPRKSTKRELSFPEVRSIIDQLYKLGCLYITFTGGEIFTRPDIFEILEYAKDRCMRINLFTNGSLIDQAAVKRLARLGGFLNRIEISFLGANPGTFETITRTLGSFQRTTEAIQLLRKAGRAVKLKIVLMRQNRAEVPAFLKTIRSYQCQEQFSVVVFPGNDGDTEPLRHRLSPSEAHEALKNISGKRPAPRGVVCHFDSCLIGKTSAAIDPYGKMSSCLLIRRPQYDLMKMPVSKAWEKIKAFWENFYRMGSLECKDCRLGRYCLSCPGYLLAETGQLNACSSWLKKIALLQMQARQF